MLAWIIGLVLAFIGILLAVVAGEARYENPRQYPKNQQFGAGVAVVMVILALATVRYL